MQAKICQSINFTFEYMLECSFLTPPAPNSVPTLFSYLPANSLATNSFGLTDGRLERLHFNYCTWGSSSYSKWRASWEKHSDKWRRGVLPAHEINWRYERYYIWCIEIEVCGGLVWLTAFSLQWAGHYETCANVSRPLLVLCPMLSPHVHTANSSTFVV